jgi:hypothetical protein
VASGQGIYLFGFALTDRLPEKLEGQGINDGSELREHRVRDLAAVICDVMLDDFTGPRGDAHLKDIAWLTPRALRHQQVLEQIGQHSPVFPARFGTIFSSLESLARILDKHHDSIRAFLEHAEGTEEWGLKGFLSQEEAREKLVDENLAAHSAELSKSPGLRYMQERRIRAEADKQLRSWVQETSTRIRNELASRAVESTERRLLSTPQGDAEGEMVLNLAFLLPKAAVDQVRAEGEQLASELREWGLSLHWTGPFPPYSFTPELAERAR